MFQRKPSRRDGQVLRAWHALLAGGFLVAFLSGDEDTYSMHVFSGYVVLAVLALRPLLAIGAPPGSPLRLPRPSVAAVKAWAGERRGRNPLLAWASVAVLAAVAAAAVTGALADVVVWLEDPHEALSEAALWPIAAHVALVVWAYKAWRNIPWGRGLPARMQRQRGAGAQDVRAPRGAVIGIAAVLVVLAITPALANPARDAILAGYLAQARQADPGFAGFSAQRGEALFRTKWAKGDERTPSCSACHTEDPRQPGRNAKTGRPIEPIAVSANAKRFTDLSEVEKQFGRDCKSVLGRDCTAAEKGDYITFMKGQ